MAAVLALSASPLLAQDNPVGGNQGGGGGRGNRGGGGGGGGGNFDPAQFQQQMQQRIMEGYRNQLGFTDDKEWTAVEPLVKKVVDARTEAMVGGMRGMMGGMMGGMRGNRGGGTNNQATASGNNNFGGGGFFGQASPEQDALQKAIESNAPAAQIKDLLAKYKAAQKAKQAKLESAQADLKKVLTVKQEAQATLLGLL